MDDGQVGRPHLDLLELLHRFVEHAEIEVDAPEREGEREVVGLTRRRRLVEGDHPSGPAFLPALLLDSG